MGDYQEKREVQLYKPPANIEDYVRSPNALVSRVLLVRFGTSCHRWTACILNTYLHSICMHCKPDVCAGGDFVGAKP